MMNFSTWAIGMMSTTLVIYIGIAWWQRRAAVRRVNTAIHPVFNGMASAAEAISVTWFLTLVGMMALQTDDSKAVILGWLGGYVCIALLFAAPLRRAGQYTLPALMRTRYHSRTVHLITVLCVLLVTGLVLIAQLRGITLIYSHWLSIPHPVGVIGTLIALGIYMLIGDHRGMSATQTAQYWVIMLAYTTVAILVFMTLTAWSSSTATNTLATPIDRDVLTPLNDILTAWGFTPYTTSLLADQSNTSAFMLTCMFGLAAMPPILTRFITDTRMKNVHSTAGWAVIFISLFFIVAGGLGMMGAFHFMTTVHPPTTAPLSQQVINDHARPTWFIQAEQYGWLQVQDKNADQHIQYYNEHNPAFAMRAQQAGWRGNEVTHIAPETILFAHMTNANLPTWAAALIPTGALAAALATMAGALFLFAVTCTHDGIQWVFKRAWSQQTTLQLQRVMIIIILGLLGVGANLFTHITPLDAMLLAINIAAATLFPMLLFSIFWRRMNPIAVVTGMVTGLTVTLLYVFQQRGIFFMPETTFLMPQWGMGTHWLFGLSPDAIGVVGASANTIVAVAMARYKPALIAQEWIDQVRVPVETQPQEGVVLFEKVDAAPSAAKQE